MKLLPSRLRTLLVLLLPALLPGRAAHAQILYARLQNNSSFQLRAVNGDGTGDSAVNTPFLNLSFPAWSRDRALIALTATDTTQFQQQVSLNVFTYNPATGAAVNVTHFVDVADAQSHSVAYAYHKAFSPDRRFVAVNSIISSGNTQGSSDTPILQIFPSDGSSGGPIATVHIGRTRDPIHHDGEGVSWSPTANLLAAPFYTETPTALGAAETTAIFLAEPVSNAGNARQLTTPHAQAQADATTGYIYDEHDYQPKFSPDGTRVAYVRSAEIAYTQNGGVPSPDVQAIHIININTGADVTVISFQQGIYVTTLDWSPDGSELVFDAGSEVINSGVPAQVVQPGTDAVYVINIDGSGVRQLLGAGSGQPAWEPLPAAHPAFFDGETALSNGVFFLRFGNGNPFGYYSYLSDPHYLFHFDLGYEYVFDAADGKSGVYLYDFKSKGFFYTSPGFPFPYLYDFSLNSVLYYYPDPKDPNRYNTGGTRFFYEFATKKIITK